MFVFTVFVLMLASTLMACSGGEETTGEMGNENTAERETQTDGQPEAVDEDGQNGTNQEETDDNEANTDATYSIPIVSKGFQHQFWQAVHNGAEQAADEFGVEITFEGPDTEAQVDKQLEMLRTALDRSGMPLDLPHWTARHPFLCSLKLRKTIFPSSPLTQVWKATFL